MILTAFTITLAVNVAGDVLLIPLFQNEGAAIAFLLACLAQVIFYFSKNNMADLRNVWQPVLVCTLCAVVGGLTARLLIGNNWPVIPTSIIFYGVLLLITGQIKRDTQIRLKAVWAK